MPRTKEIEQLRSRLRRDHFVSLSGPLSCGKTMVCQGLLQSLEEEKSTLRLLAKGKSLFKARAGLNWKTVYVRLNPAVNPYDQLARELSRPHDNPLLGPHEKVSPLLEGQIRNLLRAKDNMGLVNIYKSHPTIRKYNFLIIVDQFENLLFTTQINQDEKKNFVQLLLNASYYQNLMYCMIAVRPPRNELWKKEFGDLRDAIEHCDFPLYNLSQQSLQTAITKYYHDTSVRYKQRKTPHWKKIRAETLKVEEHQRLTEEVYTASNPLKNLSEQIVGENYKDVAEKAVVQIKVKRIGGINLDGRPREEEVKDPDEIIDMTPAINEPPETASLTEKAEFVYALLTLPEKRVARKIFLILAEEISKDPTAGLEVGHIIQRFGRFEKFVIAVSDKFALKGVLTKEGPEDNPKAVKLRIADIHLSTDWMKFGNWIADSGKSIRISGSSGGEQTERRSFTPKPIAVDIPKDSKALVDRAENTYQSFSIVLKRVCRKLFIELSQIPDNDEGQPGKEKLGVIIDNVGKFKRQFLEVSDTLVQQGVLRGPEDGDIHFDAEIGVPSMELYMFWARCREWVQEYREIPDELPGQQGGARQAEEPAFSPPPSPEPQTIANPAYESPKPYSQPEMPQEEKVVPPPISQPVSVSPKPESQPVMNEVVAQPPAPQPQSQQSGGGQGAIAAENTYNALVLPHKRVAQKLMVVIAQRGGSAMMMEILNSVGRFKAQLVEVAGTFREAGVLISDSSGPISGSTLLRFSDENLASQWRELAKWLNEN